MEVFSRAARYLDEVARRGSVRRAAKHLNIAPSAVNRHVLDLERDLDTKLFERTTKGLRLTSAGELFVHRLRSWRTDFERTRELIDGLAQLRNGRVRLACVEGVVTSVVPAVVGRFRQKHPGLTVDMEVCSADQVLQNTLDGESEIGVTFNPPPHRALHRVVNARCKIGAVVSPKDLLAERKGIRLSDLAGAAVAMPTATISLREVIDLAEERQAINLYKAAQTNSIGLLKAMARSGDYVTILNSIDVLAETQAGELVHVPFLDKIFADQTFAVVTHSIRPRTSAADALIHCFQEWTEESLSRG